MQPRAWPTAGSIVFTIITYPAPPKPHRMIAVCVLGKRVAGGSWLTRSEDIMKDPQLVSLCMLRVVILFFSFFFYQNESQIRK